MNRIYHQYILLEDYKNGMYIEEKQGRNERVLKAVNVLGDKIICEKAMNMVIDKWKYATEYNLSNDNINKKAWLGQACCSIYANIHEDETREAWGLMTNEQRTQANNIAKKIIDNWEKSMQGQLKIEGLL